MTEDERLKEERINKDPLAKLIVDITKAMKADFPRQYASQFKKDEDFRSYKRRMYQKLRGIDLMDIRSGYEAYVDSGKTYCPNIPELLEFINQARKIRRQVEKRDLEVNRVAALPPPTIECDPLQLLAEAKENSNGNNIGLSSEEKLKAHEALLVIYKSHIRHINLGPEHKCSVSFCNNLGTISSNLRGGGPFYCLEHSRQLD